MGEIDSYHELNGDVRGGFFKNTVRRIRGVLVSATTPTNGQVLQYNSSNAQYEPTTPATTTSVTMGGDVTGSSATSTVVKLQGRDISNSAPSSTNTLSWNGSAWAPASAVTTVTLSGDVTGSSNSNVVTKIQGVSVATSAPTTNQALQYNGTAWAPGITIGQSWTSFTPTLKAGSSDPTLGTGGSATGRYLQIGKLLKVQYRFAFGTASAAQGSGEYYIAMPGGFSLDTTITDPYVGTGRIHDADQNKNWLVGVLWDAANSRFKFTLDNGGTTVFDNNPFTWANNDRFHINIEIPIT